MCHACFFEKQAGSFDSTRKQADTPSSIKYRSENRWIWKNERNSDAIETLAGQREHPGPKLRHDIELPCLIFISLQSKG